MPHQPNRGHYSWVDQAREIGAEKVLAVLDSKIEEHERALVILREERKKVEEFAARKGK